MWNVEFASGVQSVASGGWSVHGVDCHVCSVWFSFVVFSMLKVKCNVGRFVPNVRCGVCLVKCRVCSLMECVECNGVCRVSHPPPPLTPRILQHPAYLIPQKAFGTFANIKTYVCTCIHRNIIHTCVHINPYLHININIYIYIYIHTYMYVYLDT